MPVDAISLEVFKNLFISVAEEMGVTLGRTAYSPNIKERRDYSCALFDAQGQMVAQAAHIPVHLGAMPASVEAAIKGFTFSPGDVVILNDPYLGGTHLPDITLVAPVFVEDGGKRVLAGFVANRGHHADIGGMTPGSLPLSTELFQEGTIIPPIKLARRGRINQEVVALLCRNSRTPDERKGDLAAQLASIRVGEQRLKEIVARYGLADIHEHMASLLDYSERMTRAAIQRIPQGAYSFLDYMDDDGIEGEPVPIAVSVTVKDDEMTFDFTGTSPQRPGSINAPLAVTVSAVLYVIRCVTGEQAPANQGCLRPVRILAPRGSLVNPEPQHAVAGGNVETSQRITDVLLGALAQALPALIPAASQGTMNNVLVGGHDPVRGKSYVYYETIAGGMGARPTKDGLSGVHTHMTNTMNTPIEALEFVYPMRLRRYSLRRGSGGAGQYRGGDGIIRDLEFMARATVTVLSERRKRAPYGLQGGEPGALGENVLLRGGVEEVRLPGKATFEVAPGDVLSIRTPGGGGWGKPARKD
ncbi:MAG: hydantoinase B/oxoprolinase family protein [Chloroflexota bacterium]|nr:hydantoinase B/oxoprolinase family protein [Chloroflexota bacterium]